MTKLCNRTSGIAFFAKYYYGDQISIEMGGACGMHGRFEKCTQNFGLKGMDHLGDTGVR
jgi:hypothetical protein